MRKLICVLRIAVGLQYVATFPGPLAEGTRSEAAAVGVKRGILRAGPIVEKPSGKRSESPVRQAPGRRSGPNPGAPSRPEPSTIQIVWKAIENAVDSIQGSGEQC